jgi:hypothetical protein
VTATISACRREPTASASFRLPQVAFGRWNAFCTHYIPWQRTADGEVRALNASRRTAGRLQAFKGRM